MQIGCSDGNDLTSWRLQELRRKSIEPSSLVQGIFGKVKQFVQAKKIEIGTITANFAFWLVC